MGRAPITGVKAHQLIWLSLALALAGCARAAPPASLTLTVFAAASLTEAFTELGQQFETAHPEAAIVFNFGGSNQLAQQINQGAPADVFASANGPALETVIQAGRMDSAAPQTVAQNRLVVIFPLANPAGITALPDLAQPGLKLVLAAPEVPAGQYALDFLEKAAQTGTYGLAFKIETLQNVVSYEENVKVVFNKVALGEADAGIVYVSDMAGAGAQAVGRLEIPDSLNTLAMYPMAVLRDSPHADLAQAFVDLARSAAGQEILARYGFLPANP